MLTGGENLSMAGVALHADHLAVLEPTDQVADADVGGDAVARTGWHGKRALDVAASAVFLVLALPILAVIAAAIKITSPGPVLFRQRRVGRHGTDFRIFKFRTMYTDAEQQLRANVELHRLFVDGSHKIPSRLDPRVTRVGRILRRTSLDELPQFLNVLLGHMSLVGPRPVERTQLERDYCGFEASYLRMRPGLTGLWQVSGRSTIQFPERAHLDSRYLAGCGPWMDAKILARTPLVIFTGLGAD
jgi:exopolysaccharide production protein ExoY